MNNCRNEYNTFIKKYFPYSGAIDRKSVEKIYRRINENALITEIFMKYIDKSPIKSNLEFLKVYKDFFNLLLLYIPINDINSINFCMRIMIESLLKFLYSIYFNDDINKISFRNMKEDFNKLKTDIFFNSKLIEVLFNYYGKYSNSIHNKNNKLNNHLEFIEKIITNKNTNFNKIDADLLNVLNVYYKIISNIYKFKISTFSTPEWTRLRKNLSPKRLAKFKQSLFS